jgi:hypothetical protein
MGGLHDYIHTLPRETITRWALITEKYHRKVNNQEHIMGGLDDYIGSLSNQEIVAKILKEVDEHRELDSREKLESLGTEYGMGGQIVSQNRGGDGGLHDFIWRLPREKLNTWALTTEAYHRDVNHQHLLGGLDDYISTLSNQQVIDYIMKEVKEHPELASQGKLDTLSTNYNINVNSVHTVKSTPLIGGGIHDIVRTLPRKELVNWAFTFERYHNEGKMIMGGLNDYIFNQSNEEVISYIMKEAGEHPEIANAQKLRELTAQFNGGEMMRKIVTDDQAVSQIISTLDRSHIVAYAIALDHYELELRPDRTGGIDDTVLALPTDELKQYLLDYLNKYFEVDSVSKLEALMKKYGVEFK